MGKEKKCTLYKKYTSYKKCIPYLILAGFTLFFLLVVCGKTWNLWSKSRLAQSA